jgi:hypothetical protein
LPKPWSILPRPRKGAATPEELYLAVGEALSAWELVEEGLAEIFATFIGSPEAGPGSGHDPAIRAFGSVLTFKGRQQMVAAAADAFFFQAVPRDPVRKQFGELNEEAAGFASRRNDIAHGRVQYLPKKGFYLFPGLYSANKNPVGQLPTYAYGRNEVLSYREQFGMLATKLTEYAIFASAWKPPPPSQKKRSRPSGQPLPLKLSRKSRAKSGRRLRSSRA